MANKYLAMILGIRSEVEALVTSAGATDAGKIVATSTDGRLSPTVMPVGLAPEVVVCPAYEALTAGNLIHLFNDGGTLKARKADASNAWRADGFILASVDSGANATVYLEGNITGLSGKTIGATQWLSATAGALVEVGSLPSGTGKIIQQIGKAVSATEITFEPDEPTTLA